MLRNPFTSPNAGRPMRGGATPPRQAGAAPQQRSEMPVSVWQADAARGQGNGQNGGQMPGQSQRPTGPTHGQNNGQNGGQMPGQSQRPTGPTHGQNNGQNGGQMPGHSHGATGPTHGQNNGQNGGRIPGHSHAQTHTQSRAPMQNAGAPGAVHPLVARQRAAAPTGQYQKVVYPVAQTAGSAGQAAAARPAMQILELDSSIPAVANFLQNNNKTGYLTVRTTAVQGAIPISDADIKIYVNLDGTRHLLVTDRSDASGITEPIPLPAPDKQLTLDPRNPRPYSSYDIVLTHPQYEDVSITEVPIFDGVTSVQAVNMVPTSQ